MKTGKQQQSQLPTADRTMNVAPQQIQDSFVSEFQFGFQVPTNFIIDLFEQVAKALKFDMIEREANHATVIKQIKKTFLQMLDCFNWVSEGNMTAIKLTIQTNEKTSKRICKLRGLVGSKREVKLFIKQFKQRSKQLIKIQNSFYPEQQQQDAENLQNPFHLEACAIYMFHKILSNEQYGIGSITKASLNNFKNKFSNVEQSSKNISLVMKSLIVVVQEIIDHLYKDFNYGKKEMEKVMPYCRVSVQKYVFGQVENILVPVYHYKWSEVDNIFEEKRKIIFSNKSLQTILEEIGLPKELWFLENGLNTSEVKPMKEWKPLVKYSQSSLQLQKIIHSKTPRQKLKQCQIAYTVLKTLFYQQSNRKKQLTNMEQIIPVLIVVILFTQISNLKGELQLVLDWIQADPCEMDSEKRLLINLNVCDVLNLGIDELYLQRLENLILKILGQTEKDQLIISFCILRRMN